MIHQAARRNIRPSFKEGTVVQFLVDDEIGHGQGDDPVRSGSDEEQLITQTSRIGKPDVKGDHLETAVVPCGHQVPGVIHMPRMMFPKV